MKRKDIIDRLSGKFHAEGLELEPEEEAFEDEGVGESCGFFHHFAVGVTAAALFLVGIFSVLGTGKAINDFIIRPRTTPKAALFLAKIWRIC